MARTKFDVLALVIKPQGTEENGTKVSLEQLMGEEYPKIEMAYSSWSIAPCISFENSSL